MSTIGRSLFHGRGSIGKEVQDGKPHGLNNPFEGAAGKTLEQDLSLLTQADAQARFAIRVRGAARSPASQRGVHALELGQNVVQSGRGRLYRRQRHRKSSFYSKMKACMDTQAINSGVLMA